MRRIKIQIYENEGTDEDLDQDVHQNEDESRNNTFNYRF